RRCRKGGVNRRFAAIILTRWTAKAWLWKEKPYIQKPLFNFNDKKTMTDKQSIALVDDDRNILTSVSMALEAEGYDVKTYNDGEEGLKGITTATPDLVVL